MGHDGNVRSGNQPITCPDVLCSSEYHGPRRQRAATFLRRWGPFCLAAILVVLFVWSDRRIKASALGAGYCPESATCIVAAEDFGRFLSGVAASDALYRLKEEWPRPLASVELALRKQTGIRPTPARWRLWLGYRLVAAHAQEGTGICVYPGLLLRILGPVHRFLTGTPEEEVSVFGNLFYGWRDGFLVASSSRKYVEATLRAGPLDVEASRRSDELLIHWRGPREGVLRVQGRDHLPLDGWVKLGITPRTEPLTLVDVWPRPPTMSITATKWSDIRTVLDVIDEAAGRWENWHKLKGSAVRFVERWNLGPLPENWDADVDHCSLALTGIDVSETLPVPEVAFVMRSTGAIGSTHPLHPLAATLAIIPYEWQGVEGELAPILGEKASLCLGRYGNDWLATSQEPLMRELSGNLHESVPVAADIVLRADWRQIGETMERLLEKAGSLELVPRKHKEEVDADLAPMARGIACLGLLELTGRIREGRLVFNGCLARPLSGVPKPSSR